ncbi:gag-pol polyprotein, partial [Trifolium medium]|nr:gag-pol polyprotein [Trifolium medium]
AQRWRELAARVQPPLLERELVNTFMSTLQGPYYEKMIWSIASGFTDMVIIGERVEEGLKSGKIKSVSNGQDVAKKFSNNNIKKKEGETNAVVAGSSQMHLTQMPYLQYPYVAAVAQGHYPQQACLIPPPQQPSTRPQQNQPGSRNNSGRKNVHFDPVPMSYGQILPYLVQKGLLELKPLRPLVPLYPPFFDVNARCDYHAGSPGHNIENCRAF